MSSGAKSIKVNMILKLVEEAVNFIYPLVTSMYVIRTIGKQNYGEIQYVRSVLSYFSLIAALGIGGYAAREGAKVRDDRQSFQKLSNEIFSISFGATSTAVLLLILFLLLIGRREREINPALYIIGFAPTVLGVLARGWINTVYEDFLYLTVRYIITSVVNTILIFAFIHSPDDHILYFLLLNSVTCVVSIINCFHVRQYSRIGFAKPNEFKKHLPPIFMIFFSGIATTIYLNSDVTLLGILVNKEAVAVYAVAATLYSMVKQISNSVVTVTIPRLSYYTGTDDELHFRALIEKMIDYVLIIVFPSVVGLCELKTHAMVFLGGAQYAEGGNVLLVLTLALPFAVLANILAQGVILPRRKEKVFLVATIASAALNIGLNFLFLPWISYLGAAVTTLLSEILIFCILLRESRKQTTLHIQVRTLVTVMSGCFAIILVCEVTKRLINNMIVCMFVAIFISVLAYGAVLVARKHSFVEDVKGLVRGMIRHT